MAGISLSGAVATEGGRRCHISSASDAGPAATATC
jgi:hypothetical protein